MPNQESDFFELTFIKKSSTKRPKTSSLFHSNPNSFRIEKKFSENDPYIKMKQLKAQAKEAEQQYISMLTNIKQSEKSISENYKEVQKKKVSFLKLYETKKLKNLSSTMEKECKTQREEKNSHIKEHVRRLKIEEELKRLITKQEKETYLAKLREDLQKEKEKFKNKKYMKSKELSNLSRNSFLNIKKAHDESKERRDQIKSVSDVRSKHFYWKKISEEILILEEYEKIIKDLEEYELFEAEKDVRAQTSQTARTSKTGFFLTEKR